MGVGDTGSQSRLDTGAVIEEDKREEGRLLLGSQSRKRSS